MRVFIYGRVIILSYEGERCRDRQGRNSTDDDPYGTVSLRGLLDIGAEELI